MEETLRALDDVVRAGKARYVGCSNYHAYQVARAIGRSEAWRLPRFDPIQPRYKLFFRQIGRELVLFDLNRSVKFGLLLRPDADTALARLLPDPPRQFRATVITNGAPIRVSSSSASPRPERRRPRCALGLSYPREVFSLSHIALPFPTSDALYGMDPDPAEDFGVNLGALAVRGERGTLIVNQDPHVLHPFFPYMLERIEEGMGATLGRASQPPAR